jgi:hypothetical protein
MPKMLGEIDPRACGLTPQVSSQNEDVIDPGDDHAGEFRIGVDQFDGVRNPMYIAGIIALRASGRLPSRGRTVLCVRE